MVLNHKRNIDYKTTKCSQKITRCEMMKIFSWIRDYVPPRSQGLTRSHVCVCCGELLVVGGGGGSDYDVKGET